MTKTPVAVVLGGSAGIGAAVVTRLAQEGYSVVALHRGHHESHPLALNIIGDAGTTREDVIKRIDVLEQHVMPRSVAVVVHSLSGAVLGSALSQGRGDVEKTFNRLAHSFLWWAQLLYGCDLLAGNARIIALSNPCADFYLANNGVIGAAKAALEAYVKQLAVELGSDGIRVNALRFGAVHTEALEKVMPDVAVKLGKLHTRIAPSMRMQLPYDVANIIAAMLSPQFGWINGAIIDGTGGSVLKLMNYAFNG